MFRLFLTITLVAIVAPIAVLAQDEKEPPAALKRLDKLSEEELRKQLFLVPEAGFDQSGAAAAHAFATKGKISADFGQRLLLQFSQQNRKPEWNALPWRKGLDCQIGKEQAERLHVFSLKLRERMMDSVRFGDVRPDVIVLRKTLEDGAALAWDKAEAVPTLAQMLQVESAPTRLLMIDMLAKIDGKEAGAVLAQRAIFDLSNEVRDRAVAALATRPREEIRPVILDALRWPWQAAAEHAAETAVALKWKELVPDLVQLLKEPDPKLPIDGKEVSVRELVRINHLCNCFLCHAPSMAREDLVRGRVPVPGQSVTPPYYGGEGSAVRADITFLRQDFSLFQPVENPGKWPGFQRFDYLLRTRKATPKEVALLRGVQKKPPESYPQRDAVLFGLRELTGEDRGIRTESWEPLLKGIQSKD